MDSPIVYYVQGVESRLNKSLGLDSGGASLTNTYAERHQFVFVPTFHASATFVIEHRTGSTLAYLALLESVSPERLGWQDVQVVAEAEWSAFVRRADRLAPWTLSHAVTESRDGMAASYRRQTAAGGAGFCAYNPDPTQHPAHIAWLRHAVTCAEAMFHSTDAVRYLETLRTYIKDPF
jgi:hypothetical protein